MTKEIRKKLIIIVISILIIAGIIFGGYKLIMGRDGIITKVANVENEFDKTEVLESLTEKVKQKYMAVYNEAKESPDKKLEEMYNVDVAISSLAEQGSLEYYYYSAYDNENYTYIVEGKIAPETPKRDDIFWINTSVIEDVKTFGKGKKFNDEKNINKVDVFLLEKRIENEIPVYKIIYYDLNGKESEVGNLELESPLIK